MKKAENNSLALFGGPKTIEAGFTPYNPIGKEEVKAAIEIIESGVLSKYIGAWHPDFFGGPKVREFELACSEFFGVLSVYMSDYQPITFDVTA